MPKGRTITPKGAKRPWSVKKGEGKNWETYKCDGCGKRLKRYKQVSERIRYRMKFCSRQCAGRRRARMGPEGGGFKIHVGRPPAIKSISLAINGVRQRFTVIPKEVFDNTKAFMATDVPKGKRETDPVTGQFIPAYKNPPAPPGGILGEAPPKRQKGRPGRRKRTDFAFQAGLTLTRLPPGFKGIRKRLTQFTHKLEEETRLLFAGGKPGLLVLAMCQTACRYELQAQIARKMMLENYKTLTVEQWKMLSESHAKASEARDKTLQRIGLGALCKPPEVIDPFFVEAIPARELPASAYDRQEPEANSDDDERADTESATPEE